MTVFMRARWAVGLAVALAIGSMIRYPGGTGLDAATRRYSISQNFLSDLGMTVAYDHQPNRLGAALFVASLITLVVGLGGCIPELVRLYSTSRRARKLARAAAAVALLVCAAFVGVAMTPENRAMDLHISATLLAFRVFPILSLLFLLATIYSPVFRPRVAVAWALLTVALTIYAGIQGWGPTLATTDGRYIQVAAQKIIVTICVFTFLFVTAEADRALTTQRQ